MKNQLSSVMMFDCQAVTSCHAFSLDDYDKQYWAPGCEVHSWSLNPLQTRKMKSGPLGNCQNCLWLLKRISLWLTPSTSAFCWWWTDFLPFVWLKMSFKFCLAAVTQWMQSQNLWFISHGCYYWEYWWCHWRWETLIGSCWRSRWQEWSCC